jgi:hypothetical protein
VTTQNLMPHLLGTREHRSRLSLEAPRTRPLLTLPALPVNAVERAEVLPSLAADIAAWCGPVATLALVSAAGPPVRGAAAQTPGQAARR